MSDDPPAPEPAPSGETIRGPRIWPTVRAIMRTRIVAGLLTIIPIWVTYYIVRFVFDMMRSATEPLAKQIVSTLGGPTAGRYHRVVLVEVPRPGMKRIAFLTSVMTDSDTGRKLANVFIPYTPYLTTGYMQIVPLEDVSETHWTFEEAAK